MSRESVETQTGEQQEIQLKKERIWMSVVWRFLDVGMAWRNMPSTWCMGKFMDMLLSPGELLHSQECGVLLVWCHLQVLAMVKKEWSSNFQENESGIVSYACKSSWLVLSGTDMIMSNFACIWILLHGYSLVLFQSWNFLCVLMIFHVYQ